MSIRVSMLAVLLSGSLLSAQETLQPAQQPAEQPAPVRTDDPGADPGPYVSDEPAKRVAGASTSGPGKGVATQTVTDDSSGNMIFSTGNVERMRITTDGNVGIGTTDPLVALQVEGNVQAGGISHGTHLATVGGGQLRSSTSPVTGYVKITLPQSWMSTMMIMHVDIFDYVNNRSRTLIVGGYCYSPGTTWLRTFAAQMAGDDTAIRVDYGHDGTNLAIYLSKGTSGAATTWAYPHVVVRDFFAAYSNSAATKWDDGWSVTVTPTLAGTITAFNVANPPVSGLGTANAIPKFNSGSGVADSGIYETSGGFVGFGTTAPVVKLHAVGAASTVMRIEATNADQVAGVQFKNDARIWQVVTDGGDADKFFIRDGGTSRFAIDTAGQVGIGTAAPAAKLDVAGTVRATSIAGPNWTGAVSNGELKGFKVIGAVYQDVAEWVPATTDLAPGTVVILNPAKTNEVMASNAPYDTSVAGVVSEQPGLILGMEGEGKEQVATTGRVKVRVDARRAAIAVGDLLVTSDVPGTAMKSEPMEIQGRRFHQPGTIVGKALEPLAGGTGEILVLLSMQ